MQIGERDEQENENNLTISMNKFEDFKMANGENITEMETRLMKLLNDFSRTPKGMGNEGHNYEGS